MCKLFVLCIVLNIIKIDSILHCNYNSIYEECLHNKNFYTDLHKSVIYSNELCDPLLPNIYCALEYYCNYDEANSCMDNNNHCDILVHKYLATFFSYVINNGIKLYDMNYYLNYILNNDNTYIHKIYNKYCNCSQSITFSQTITINDNQTL